MPATDHNPAVSVVVPCYNGARFIDQLMATLAAQTFRDFEIIIVDDGSGEETRAKLDSLGPTVRVIHQVNQGPGAARNTGIEAARAEIVLALDCDDLLEPSYLAETVPVMQAAPADVGLLLTHERMSGLRQGVEEHYFKFFDQLFINRVPSCLMMRKEAWRNAGGYDAAMREGYEDWEFTIAMAAAGYRCIEIPKPLFIYRVSNDGLLLRLSSKLHAQLWARIRRKHRDLYRLPALLRLWWTSRHQPGEMSLGRAFALLTAGTLLPDRSFNALINRVRALKMAQ
ncbi:MAG: glycosyltransferase family A protein [Pseudorhodoplanes sp.]|jgi:glycosyltransferase involved in cell wall biosynthesis|nr:glycosyltransferase family A protein [Pseudorhodoplanes sp.]